LQGFPIERTPFFRRFKEATGLSPINWLRRERINSAQAQLLNSAASIKEIADG
jgi:transcriptional regulator GlxA family with amidase domain